MKRWIAALLCVMLLCALLPASAWADFDRTSNRGVELVLPEEKDCFNKPFWCRLFSNEYVQGLYLMPLPETGHGNLGSVTAPGKVYVVGEKNGFFYCVTNDGKQGWIWNEWFDFDRDNTSLAKGDPAEEFEGRPTRSTRGAKLSLPNEDEYYDEPETLTVQTKTACGSIYLMPKPETGHGNLGIVRCGEDVKVLAERDGFLFLETEDGRCGWNSGEWLV